jgi:hypothetical protein
MMLGGHLGVSSMHRCWADPDGLREAMTVQVNLTTKLTTERLDVLGRRWTIHHQESQILGVSRRPWTSLDTAPRAPQPQGAGAIPVPPALRES